MDEHGYRVFTPLAPGPSAQLAPLLDLQSGYVLRSIDALPKQGDRPPWRMHQNYPLDVRMLRHGPLEDEGIAFSAGRPAAAAEPPELIAA